MDNLQRRLEHFQWIVEQLSKTGNVFYLEKDWYDNPTLITEEVAKKEIKQIELELHSKNIWRSMLRLFRR